MSTKQVRKTLSAINDSIRIDNTNLKNKQSQILQHIQILIKRQKQLSKLKQQLIDQLYKAEQITLKQKKTKQQKCLILQSDNKILNQKLKQNDIKLLNLQQEYKLCLNDYDKILNEISSLIQNNKIIEMQFLQEKQKQSTIKAMIFDYQRLHRVLQQEKKYFKELSNNQEKSHAQRMKQFQKIKNKLIKQEKQTLNKKQTNRFKIGFIKLNQFYKRVFNGYAYKFLRGHYKYQKITSLGISKLANCLTIATMKYQKQIRSKFFQWHNNVFHKNVLNHIVQNALTKSIQSKTKITVLRKMIQKINSDNLSLLHLYQRAKILSLTANSIKHKQKHIAFNIWRDNAQKLTKQKYYLTRLCNKILKFYQIRFGFNELKNKTYFLKRFQIASHLLTQFQNTKQMARIFRKWRIQIYNRQYQIVQKYIQNIKIRNIIQSRLKYQKRKVKIITNLQLSMSKIQLKTYFLRYYHNVKSQNILKLSNKLTETKDQLSITRKQNKQLQSFLFKKNIKIALNLTENYFNKSQLNPYFKKWKNNAFYLTNRNNKIWHLILRKQAKNKFLVINQFRKVVQYHQKKQMHQVLTDLNNKMEQINEKSTQFRKALKEKIQNLGILSSKRINEVSTYTLNCQKRVLFNWCSRVSIKTKYKYYLISRLLEIFTHQSYKNTLRKIETYGKQIQRQKNISSKLQKFQQKSLKRSLKKAFYGLLNQLKIHKKAFAKFIHVQNVLYFYRLESSFIAIRKKAHLENKKNQQIKYSKLDQQLTSRKDNLISIKSSKSNLQEKLKKLFINFVNFQQRFIKNKQKIFYEQKKRKYFEIYRKKVKQTKGTQKILQNLVHFIEYKNYFIFWKSLLVIKYESNHEKIKQQLMKVNKKNKNFEQKVQKNRIDVQRKMSQQTFQYTKIKKQANYYSNKYTNILKYYDQKHIKIQSNSYIRQIFKVWKNQYLGTKKLGQSIQKILHRSQIIEPYQLLYNQFKAYDSKFKSQILCGSLLEKKCKKMMIDGFNYWRYNMRHGYCERINYKINNIDEYYQRIKYESLETAENIVNQKFRNIIYNLKSSIYMTFKNQWIKSKLMKKRLSVLQQKIQKRRVFQAMRNWKWLRFYKLTKRSYLKYKLLSIKKSLKSDVFLSLKIHRQQLYNFFDRIRKFIQNRKYYFTRFAMSKIVNVASLEKNQLIHARKKAIHSLLMNKITKQKLIKRKLMWKWQSLLIPKTHYLPTILKQIQLRIIKSAFANINEKKYWHQHYVKIVADKITSQGYSDVNSVTNILVRQGFDPDQLKDYLKEKNDKDTKIITNVIGHLKAWPQKQKMVRAFHSWKQFIQIKKNIKRVLSKVFNFSSGLGRYFNKWRKKDPHFNEILQKQSRANMLQRYNELDKLMKEYRRDIKQSLLNCEQLKQINDENSRKTIMTVQMAFSNLANNIHKGMKQGFNIWRLNVRKQKRQQLNQRYDQIVDGIQIIDSRKRKAQQRIKTLQIQNKQLKIKCQWGQQCGELLKKLMFQKDGLTIDLAQKQHNLKILLEDNLRLKQKIKSAKQNALKLINKIRQQQIS